MGGTAAPWGHGDRSCSSPHCPLVPRPVGCLGAGAHGGVAGGHGGGHADLPGGRQPPPHLQLDTVRTPSLSPVPGPSPARPTSSVCWWPCHVPVPAVGSPCLCPCPSCAHQWPCQVSGARLCPLPLSLPCPLPLSLPCPLPVPMSLSCPVLCPLSLPHPPSPCHVPCAGVPAVSPHPRPCPCRAAPPRPLPCPSPPCPCPGVPAPRAAAAASVASVASGAVPGQAPPGPGQGVSRGNRQPRL